jgi:uncharacterized iron-regulated protein
MKYILQSFFYRQQILTASLLLVVFTFVTDQTVYAQTDDIKQSEHVLLDKIWDTSARQYISKAELFEQLLTADYLLLGEHHDNPHHHQHQARIISHLHNKQRLASVSFEMISSTQHRLLQQHQWQTVDEFIAILDREKNSWGYTKFYKDVFSNVLLAGFEIHPANLPKKQLMAYAMQEEQVPDDIQQIMDAASFSEQQKTSLKNEIIAAHCNLIRADSSSPMLSIQRIRDAVMSRSLLESRSKMRILIAGASHTRKDRGVPFYLARQKSQGKVISVAFIEVQQDKPQISDYYERWDSQQLPFDYAWFTPAVDRGDPCEKLRKRFQHKHDK